MKNARGIVTDITAFVDAVAWLDALAAATFQRFPVVGVTTHQVWHSLLLPAHA